MAVSQQQKVDFLLKKLGFTKTKTGLAVDSTLTGTKKAGFAEAIPSPLIIANSSVWNEADSIPATPPGSDTNQVRVYLAASSGHRMTVDSTVASNRAFIAFSTYNDTSSARLNNWIDTQFGAGYLIKVFKGDPNSGGVQLSAAGSGQNDGWFFDYSAGVLNFNDTNVPSGVTGTNIYIVGYRYIGQTGAPTSGISTFSFLDLSVERNLDVGVQGGISTFRNNIDANGIIEGVAGENKIPFLYSDLASLPSAGTYHGMFAHVHSEGRGYFAHAGNWLELVNKDTSGNVGLSGDLDVDGHTNLDNVSVSGVSTFTDNIIADRNIGIGTDNPAAPLHISGPDAASAMIKIEDNNNNIAASEILVQNGGRDLRISAPNDIIFTRVSGGTPLLYLENGQNLGIGTDNPSAKLDVFGNTILRNDLDVDGHTNLDNVSIAGVTTLTQDLDVDGHTNLDNVSIAGVTTFSDDTHFRDTVRFQDGSGSSKINFFTFGRLQFNDNVQAAFGNSSQSRISHNGSHLTISNNAGGSYTGTGNIKIQADEGKESIVGIQSGSVELYYDNTKRFETSSSGINVVGTTTSTQLAITGVSTFTGNIDANGDLDVDGHTNLDNVSIAGVTTFSDTVKVGTGVTALTNGNVSIGGTFEIFESSGIANRNFSQFKLSNFSISQFQNTGSYLIKNSSTGQLLIGGGSGGNGGIGLYNNNLGAKYLRTHSEGSVEIFHDNTVRFETSGIGATVYGQLDTTDLDVDGHAEFDAISVSGVTTSKGIFHIRPSSGALSPKISYNDSIADALIFADNVEARFGVSSDLKIYHNGSHSIISNKTGNLKIEPKEGEKGIVLVPDAQVELYFDNDKRLETSSVGVNIVKDLDVDGHTNLDNLSVAGVSTFTGDATFIGNVSIGGTLTYEDVKNVDAVGLITARSGIRVLSDVIEAQAGENKIPSLYADLAALPSASTYHGMFAHVHATGRGYFAHAGNWLELVNKDTSGNVGLSGDLDVDGHTNLDNVSIAGVTTATGLVGFGTDTTYEDYAKIRLGNKVAGGNRVGDFVIGHNPTLYGAVYNELVSTNGNILLENRDSGANKYLYLKSDQVQIRSYTGNESFITCGLNADVKLWYNNVEKLATTNTGINVIGNVVSDGLVIDGDSDLNGDLDVDGHTNLDNVSIAGVTTITSSASSALYVAGRTVLGNNTNLPTFNAATLLAVANLSGNNNFVDMTILGGRTGRSMVKFGDQDNKETGSIQYHHSDDSLKFFTNGSSTERLIINSTGNVKITNDLDVVGIATLGSGASGYAELFYQGVKKFQTMHYGALIPGSLVANYDIKVGSYVGKLIAGTNNEFTIQHDNTNTIIDNTVGILDIKSQQVAISTHLSVGGISTFSNEIKIPDSVQITLGDSDDTKIQHDSYRTIIRQHGTGPFVLDLLGDNRYFSITRSNLSEKVAEFFTNGPIDLYYDNVKRFSTSGVGATVYGNLDVTADLDVDGHTNLDNVSIAGVTTITQDLDVDGHTNLDNVNIVGVTTFSDHIHLKADNKHLYIGASDDFSIQHNGTNTFLRNGEGQIFIQDDQGVNITNTASNKSSANFYPNDGVYLYFNGNQKLRTTNTGVTVTGTVVATGADINGDIDVDGHTNLDNVSIAGVTTFAGAIDANGNLDVAGISTLGSGGSGSVDLQYQGSTKLVTQSWGIDVSGVIQGETAIQCHTNATGALAKTTHGLIHGQQKQAIFQFNSVDDKIYLINNTSDKEFALLANNSGDVGWKVIPDGAVELYHNNIKRLETSSVGVSIPQDLDVDGHTELDNLRVSGIATVQSNLHLPDASKLLMGDNNEFRIYHNESNSLNYIVAQNNGPLLLRSSNADMIHCAPQGAVTLKYDGTTRAATSSSGFDVSGTLNVTGISTFAGAIDANGDLDVDGHTNLDNLSVAGVTTFTGTAEFDGNAKFDSTITAGGSTGTNGQYLKSTGSGVAWETFPTARTSQAFTASSGQTTFSFSYTVGLVDVFVNGIKLSTSEFTATNGSSVVLAVGCFVGDIVEILSYNVASGLGGGLSNIVEDVTPQLGGNLDLFNKTINGTGNINITGVATATKFVGDGSGLTGIVASGSGVIVKDSGSTVGTAQTIDFGSNLSLSSISAGIVTVTATNTQLTTEEVQDIVGAMFSGNTETNITATYQDSDGTIDLIASGGSATTINNNADNRIITGSGTANTLEAESGLTFDGSTLLNAGSGFKGITIAPNTNNSATLRLQNSARNFSVSNITGGTFSIADGSDTRLTINSSGTVGINNDLDVDGHTNLDNVSIAGVVTATTFKGALEATSASFSSNIDANGDLDVDGHTNLDNVNIVGVTTVNGNIDLSTGSSPFIKMKNDINRSKYYVWSSSQYAIGADNSTYGGLDATAMTFQMPNIDNGGWLFLDSAHSSSGGVMALTTLGEMTVAHSLRLGYGTGDTTTPGATDRLDVNGSIKATGADINGDLDVDGHTNLDNVSISGVCTAANFVGDGSGLTGITASGSGVIIKHDGSTVGTAGTINFSTNLDVSAISAGIVTITASGGAAGLTTDAQGNTVGGANAGANFDGTNAQSNTLIGNNAGNDITTGDYNTCVGALAGDQITVNGYHTYIGYNAGGSDQGSGFGRNTAIGSNAGANIRSSYGAETNVAVGAQCFSGNSGSANVYMGYYAGGSMGGPESSNVAIGYQAMQDTESAANNNVAIGREAMEVVERPNNVAIGYKAGETLGHGENNIIIGANSAASSTTADNEITLGDTNITKFRIPGIGVTFKDNGGTPTQGHVLTVDANGEASFAAASGGTDVGITTNLSGSFTASAGSPSTINTFGYGSGDIVVEYTVFIKNGSDFQSQKLLAMRDGTTIHSTQFAVMYSSSLLVQLDATISSGNILLRATPETGVSGSTTYKIKREVM